MLQPAANDTPIIAVVIWYEPEPFMQRNILSYAYNVDYVVVVDNSVDDNMAMLPCLNNVIYIPLKYNAGIASALNYGISKAAELGAVWVLMMDQDSRFEVNEFERLKVTALALQHDKQVAVIGPITDPKKNKDYKLKEVNEIITSGSLSRLSNLQNLGGFDNKLFIDCVDFDFCFRLRESGYKIIMDKSSRLDHRRGTPTTVTWRGRDKTIFNYSSTRYYYQVRNNLYLGYRFPEYRKSSRKKIRRIIRNALLFEKHKYHNLMAIGQGVLHFLFGRYGPR
jgi:rhamnosyltransferase